MESYKVKWRKSTKKDLRRIAPTEVKKIVLAALTLAKNTFPVGCVKLQGSDCSYRIRVGDYRIIYEVYEEHITIEVARIRHRRDFYKKKS